MSSRPDPSHPAAPRLRPHQRQLLALVEAIARGDAEMADVRDILAAVTPGGGKSLLPVIAAARLIGAGVVERVVWIVPRDSLRLQAEEAFADPVWRAALEHDLSVRAAANAPDPARGLAGYVTTYQAIAAAPELHRREAECVPTLVVTDEVHHLPALGEPWGPGDDSRLFADPASRTMAGAGSETRASPDGAVTLGDAATPDEASAWSRALEPALEAARLRLHLSGTLERADGRAILGLPYKRATRGKGVHGGIVREVDLAASGWRTIGYSRAQALRDKAVLPVTFGAMDGMATWSVPAGSAVAAGAIEGKAVGGVSPNIAEGRTVLEERTVSARPTATIEGAAAPTSERDTREHECPARVTVGPHSLSAPFPCETTRPALFTALRTGFADALLRRAFEAARDLRAERWGARRTGRVGQAGRIGPDGRPPDELPLPSAPGEWIVGSGSRRRAHGPEANGDEANRHAADERGLGKLLIVAPDQACARQYLATLRSWLAPGTSEREAMLATSSERDARETIAAFRLLPSPSILVTVAMAYEGLDAPEVAVIGCLTHIRSRPWLEQMIARATRVDPYAGPVEEQRALVFHPDDPLFASFRRKVETEQGTRSRPRKGRPERYELPLWVATELAEQRADREPEIVPIASQALGMWFGTLAPGPEIRGAATVSSIDAQGSAMPGPASSGADGRYPNARGSMRAPNGDVGALPPSPSRRERELRVRLADAIAAQTVEDDAAERARWGARAGGGRTGGNGTPEERVSAPAKRVSGLAVTDNVTTGDATDGPAGGSCGSPTELFGEPPLPKVKRCRERPARQLAFGPHRTHRYNAILKRALGKARGEMTIAELEHALSWLERNRLADHAHLLEGDERYAWAVRQSAGKRRTTT